MVVSMTTWAASHSGEAPTSPADGATSGAEGSLVAQAADAGSQATDADASGEDRQDAEDAETTDANTNGEDSETPSSDTVDREQPDTVRNDGETSEDSSASGTFVPESDEDPDTAEEAGAGGTFVPSSDAGDNGAGGTFVPNGGDTNEQDEQDNSGAGGTFVPSDDTGDADAESDAGGTFVPDGGAEDESGPEGSGAGGTFVPGDASEQEESGTSDDAGAGGTFMPSDSADTDDTERDAGGSFEPSEDSQDGAGGTFTPGTGEGDSQETPEDDGAGGTFTPDAGESSGAGGTFAPSADGGTEDGEATESGAGGTFAPSPSSDTGADDSEVPAQDEPAGQEYDESYYDSMWDDYDEAYGADEVEEEPAEEVAEEMGRIEGTVIDGEFDEPAAGITVSIDETEDALQTGESGYFYFDLPPGVYTVRFRGLGFENQVYSIEVQEGEVSEFEDGVVMGVDRDTTMTMEVEAEIDRGSEVGQMVQRREAATTRDAISSETISRTGDSSAKDAARRVVGVTLVDDKFLYVRGLGGRYTKVTLNDVPVPIILSTIPAVELDLLPTSLLSGLELYKVPEARLPGDFVGGLLNLQTSDYSDNFEFSIDISASFNTQSAFQDVEVNENRGRWDWLGYDDGTRELPSSFDGLFLTPAGFGQEGLSREEINALARELNNNFGVTEQTAPPEIGGGFEVSDTLDLRGESELAYRLAFDYGQGFSRTEYEVREIPDNSGGDELVPQGEQSGSKSQYASEIGALGGLQYDIDDDNRLEFVLFYTNVLEDSITSIDGSTDEENLVEQTSYEFSRRNVLMAQLLGEHRDLPGDLELDYTFTVSRGRNYQPDRREISYVDTLPDNADDDFVFSQESGSGLRIYRDLTQSEYDGRLDLEIPIGDQFLRRAVRIGGTGRYITREYETRRFRYTELSGSEADLTQDPEIILADEQIGESIDFREKTIPTNPYDAWQAFGAGYGQIDWEFSEKFRAAAGVRFESLTQEIDGKTADGDGRRVDFDVLPSTSMVYSVNDDMSFRLAYAASVARPSVRESSASTEFDYVRGFEIIGNPDLERTYVHNADLRYEFFPSPAEVVAATVYYKQFINHIEPVVQNLGGSIAYENTSAARSFGGELEVQLDWGEHVPALEGLKTAFNVAAIYSRVELDGSCGEDDGDSGNIFTNCERPMVGQAPVALNTLVGYGQDDVYGINLVYNMVGPILLYPGANGQRDIYSSFYHDLDMTAFWQFHDNWKLKFKADNLVHWANKEYFGRNTSGEGFLLEREQEGTTFSIGIEFSLAGQDSGDSDVRTEATVGGEELDLDETSQEMDADTDAGETDPVEEAIEEETEDPEEVPESPEAPSQEDVEQDTSGEEPAVETDASADVPTDTIPESTNEDVDAEPESGTPPPASDDENGAGGVFVPGASEPSNSEQTQDEVPDDNGSDNGASGVFMPEDARGDGVQ
jgi:hypothetical protein